jgi:hypothetical protein
MKRLLIALLLLGLVSTASAETPPQNHAGISFTGFAGFLRHNVGSFVFFYERGLTEHHAVRLAGDFIHVHHAADHVQSHQWTYGGSFGYRYHLRPGGGLFVGAEVGYRRGHGHFGKMDDPNHAMLENRQLRAMPELGYRVLHPRLPLSFVARVAAGYGPYEVTTTRDDAVGAAAAEFSEDNLSATPIAFDVELSVAYAF